MNNVKKTQLAVTAKAIAEKVNKSNLFTYYLIADLRDISGEGQRVFR